MKGNKAVIFSVDAVAAIAITAILLSIAYSNLRTESTLPYASMARFGADSVNVLDIDGTLDTLNAGLIEGRLDSIMPPNYDIKFRIDCKTGLIIDTNKTLPSHENIGSGEIYFVSSSDEIDNICKMRYWIWLK